MEIIFSEAQSDADSDIKAAISHEANPRAIVVVTSDAAIRRFVMRYGATVTEATAFLDEVEAALKESSIPRDEPIEKYEGTAGDDAAYWLRVFGESEPKNGRGGDG
jgi:predicted RNA-binding protein with PIN domain